MSSASGTGCRWRIERWARPLGAVAAIFAVAGTGLAQDPCWDNDIEPNGFSARATSPPALPNNRVVSDFTVPEEGLGITGLRVAQAEDADWVAALPVQVYVYTDSGDCPGDLLLSFETNDVVRAFQGYQLFGRDVYEYSISFEPLGLGPGRYHIGTRFPNAGGAGTTWWLTSDGRDGADRTDCFSIDAGVTWRSAGARWHMAFELLCDVEPPITGACCFGDTSCLVVAEDVCLSFGGIYQGDDVRCEDADCTGACCFDDGSCERLDLPGCEDAGGDFQGSGLSCEDAACPQPGACCFDDGSCEQLIAAACAVAGGVFQGEDVSCDDADCPQPPPGACCLEDDSCKELTPVICALLGGSFRGSGVPCEDVNCSVGVCWDNDIVPNGFNARASSPPLFPDIRVVSDFTAPAGGIEVLTLRTAHVEDASWVPNLPVEVYVYADGGTCPGGLLHSIQTDDVERVFQGYQLFDRDVYEYWISFDPLGLAPGRYHIGSRWPNAGGDGTTYWLTSDGRDGADRTDCFSLDSGSTWQDSGPDWHHAFVLVCGGGTGIGACCLEDGRCLVVREGVCAALNGAYQGNDTSCEDANCPTGACCFGDGGCEVLAPYMCDDAGGYYQGNDVSCEDADCGPGACCFDDGSCEQLIAAACAVAGGVFQGEDVSCDDADCPTGACCFGDGSCERLARFECDDAGGAFQGNGLSCADAGCPQPGACCFDDGSCTFVLPDACVAAGGVYQGGGVSCEDADCPVLAGACCLPDGSCESLRLVPCAQRGGVFQGEGVSCDDTDCPPPPPVCWDNDIVANGFNGRGTSPPLFPDMRVVDDFVVPAEGAEVASLRQTSIEDLDWVATPPVEVYVYRDGGNAPGALLTSFAANAERIFLDYQLFDRDVYEYWITFEPITFNPGRYYIGSRWPNGGGAGTNYWLTSDGGEGTDRTGFFSLDSGSTWQDEGDGWHHAFVIPCANARGACCLSDGTCVDDVTERECLDTERFALYQGDDTTCADVECKARPCPADLDGDEDVDFEDLVLLLDAWGPCPDCPADIDRDGDVDFDDLLVLLDTWGPCPGA